MYIFAKIGSKKLLSGANAPGAVLPIRAVASCNVFLCDGGMNSQSSRRRCVVSRLSNLLHRFFQIAETVVLFQRCNSFKQFVFVCAV